MNILEKIIEQKKREVATRKKQRSIADLEKGAFFGKETLFLEKFLLDPSRTGIIAEFKRASPSKGIINDRSTVAAVTAAYAQYGASGISVLTDGEFFKGSLEDLVAATVNEVPLLRKDFMIDAYQVVEAKAYGADVVLLIAACLSPQEIKYLATAARNLGLEVLLELHGEQELDHICSEVNLVGINNRNLKNFEVDLEQSVRLSQKIGDDFIKIAESGISSVSDIRYLKEQGFQGYLIGELFMKQADPAAAFREFTGSFKSVAS